MTTALAALYGLQQWYLGLFVGLFFVQLGCYGLGVWAVLKGGAPDPSGSPEPSGAPHPRGAPDASGARARHTGHVGLAAVLIVAALLRVIALFAPQALSTDAFRYVWDGRVQAAGINPYRYVPADPALAPLRDAAIYPNINRAAYAHTIYPPAAQGVFLVAERLSDSITGMKLVMVACEAVTIVCLICLLACCGLPTTRVLLYAWHPLPLWEFAGTGHVDAAAIALLLAGCLLAARRSPGWAGVALAAATLVKYYPVVAVPALYRRWSWRMPAAFVATAALLYLPYLGAGRAVLGFLPGYAQEEGLNDGSGIFLWSLARRCFALPADGLHYYLPIASGVMVASAVWVQLRQRADIGRVDTSRILLLAGVFTVLASPHNAWYFAWLVPFLCFRFSLAHLWLTAACAAIYVLPSPLGLASQSLLYVPFLLLVLAQWCLGPRGTSPEIADVNRSRNPSLV